FSPLRAGVRLRPDRPGSRGVAQEAIAATREGAGRRRGDGGAALRKLVESQRPSAHAGAGRGVWTGAGDGQYPVFRGAATDTGSAPGSGSPGGRPGDEAVAP